MSYSGIPEVLEKTLTVELGPEEVRRTDERIAVEWAQLTADGVNDNAVAEARALIATLKQTLRERYTMSGRASRALDEAERIVVADVKAFVVARVRWPNMRF